ncbi:MAG: hypothetical protein ACE5JO_14470, partial [Candidatus Binatia bacterium]
MLKFKALVPLTLLSLLTLVPSSAAQIEPLLKEGEEHLEAWRLPQAEEIASRLVRENPKSLGALDLHGRVKFYQGRYEEALRSLEQALAIESANERRQALRILAQQTRDTVKKLKRF